MTRFDDLADLIYESIDTFENLHSYREAKRAFDNAYASVCLERTDGCVARAAKLSKKDRKDFYDLMHRTNVDPNTFRS